MKKPAHSSFEGPTYGEAYRDGPNGMLIPIKLIRDKDGKLKKVDDPSRKPIRSASAQKTSKK